MEEIGQTESPAPRRDGMRRGLVGVAVVAALSGGLVYAFWSSPTVKESNTPEDGPRTPAAESAGPETNTPSLTVSPKPSAPSRSTEDERMTLAIVGRWSTQRETDHRDLTVNADGTATVHVQIQSFIRQALFGTKTLDLEIEWKIESGKLHFKTVGGKPEAAIEFLKKSYGESAEYEILECTETRLLIKGDDEPDHDWSRPTAKSTAETGPVK